MRMRNKPIRENTVRAFLHALDIGRKDGYQKREEELGTRKTENLASYSKRNPLFQVVNLISLPIKVVFVDGVQYGTILPKKYLRSDIVGK